LLLLAPLKTKKKQSNFFLISSHLLLDQVVLDVTEIKFVQSTQNVSARDALAIAGLAEVV
jgi:hypothetical protein